MTINPVRKKCHKSTYTNFYDTTLTSFQYEVKKYITFVRVFVRAMGCNLSASL